jgi:serine protease Do
VKLTVTRKGLEKTINVTLELPVQREAALVPDAPEPRGGSIPQLGLTVAPKAGTAGVVVTNVDPEGAAVEHGFKTGDVILEVAGRKVGSAGDMRNAVQAAEKGGRRTVLMRVKSGDATKYVTLPVGHG